MTSRSIILKAQRVRDRRKLPNWIAVKTIRSLKAASWSQHGPKTSSKHCNTIQKQTSVGSKRCSLSGTCHKNRWGFGLVPHVVTGQVSALAHGSVTMLTWVEFENSVVVVAKEPCRAYFPSLCLKTTKQILVKFSRIVLWSMLPLINFCLTLTYFQGH
jgi:hypothetical protein